MKNVKYTLQIGFILGILFLYQSNTYAQGFSFQNPITGLYEIESWMVDQLHRDSDELRLLTIEVHAKTDRIKYLEIIHTKHIEVIDNQKDVVDALYFIIDKKDEKFNYLEDVYTSSMNLHSSYNDEIKDLQWKNTKLELQKKWLSIGGGLSGGILLVVIVRELIRN